jgi:hypothetical protein
LFLFYRVSFRRVKRLSKAAQGHRIKATKNGLLTRGEIAMQFIEMSGRTLFELAKEEGPSPEELAAVGVENSSVVRINRQGDIEIRRVHGWDLIGGLLGDFDTRVRHQTGLDWA